MRIYKVFLVFVITITFILSGCNKTDNTVLLIVGADVKNKAVDELEYFSDALHNDGLTAIIVDEFSYSPDTIRNVIYEYYLDRNIEGVIFIGDIPVPMLRDAQHLTSAFKMDQQRYPFYRSSIPSDRYYEDFDLAFDFLMQDTVSPHLFYYSLNYKSPQLLTPDIYSGRIRIPWDDDNCTLLKAYLKKAADSHLNPDPVEKIMFFAGHGYNSESITARLDEKVTLLQQFPGLNRQNKGLEFIDHSFEEYIKYPLLAELADPDLDIALLHHHGGADAQYLNGDKAANGVNDNIRSIKIYLRSKLRNAAERGSNLEKVKADYANRLGVPLAWFDDTFTEEITEQDSIHWADMDIDGPELENYSPGVRFIMFDACFTGSFQKDYYISGRYVFGGGNTIAVQANSVNVIQDKFPDEMVGLLGAGFRLGEWNRNTAFLETHIIGDPTFRFKASDLNDLSGKVNKIRTDNRKLLRLLSSVNPDIRSWALAQLYRNGYAGISELCKDTYFRSEYNSVRMECLHILSCIRDENFVEVTGAGLSDSYELVRRMSSVYAAKSGDPSLIPSIVKAGLDPNVSKRVEYQLRDAAAFFNRSDFMSCLEEKSKDLPQYPYYKELTEKVSGWSETGYNSYLRYMNEITSDSSSFKDKKFAVRALRNKPYHEGVDILLTMLQNNNNTELSVMLTEALGWFNYSYRRDEIISVCEDIITSDNFPDEIKQEAVRTVSRLK